MHANKSAIKVHQNLRSTCISCFLQDMHCAKAEKIHCVTSVTDILISTESHGEIVEETQYSRTGINEIFYNKKRFDGNMHHGKDIHNRCT